MALAFSTNSDDVFTKVIDCGHDQELKEAEIENYFELDKCRSFIENGSFERVALQFPDELITYSFRVMKLIEEKFPNVKLYVLGDTSYGSCCVDEIAAEHINADCIIHFGRSCLSITKRLPVHFVFGKGFIDVGNFCQEFLRVFEDKSERILLFYDVGYRYVAEEIENNLKMVYSSLLVSKLVTDKDRGCMKSLENGINFEEVLPDSRFVASGSCVNANRTCPWNSNMETYGKFFCDERKIDESVSIHQRFGRIFTHPSDVPLENYAILHIGKESLSLVNLMLSYNRNKFFTYDPERKLIQRETVNINKTLMKRYYLIQKTKEAKTIGIVAGTLGVADYLLIIEHLKKLIKSRGKKYYTFLMGKPNIAKMANFLEIDIFVLVACPENSLIDSQEFYKPIITPFELEIACSRQRSWTGEYITDYREILPDDKWLTDMEEKDGLNVVEEPEYSLISGNLIKNMNMNEQDISCDVPSDLVSRNQENSLVNVGENSAASFLQARIWSGLEQNLGKNELTNVVEGRTGIATGYTHEMKEKDC